MQLRRLQERQTEVNNMGLDFKAPCKFTLSANEIRVFGECARKRYYSSRDCLAIRSNTPRKNLVLGSAFHSALQYYYTTVDAALAAKYNGIDHVITKDDVQEVFDSIDEYPLTTKVLDAETGEVIEETPIVDSTDFSTLKNMIECYKPQIVKDLVEYEVISCESVFNMENWPIDDVMYHGFIDMVVRKRSNDMIYFFEHKTCANFRPEIYSRFDIQLHIYSIYGRKEYGDLFGGILLNQVKKAKTAKGYDQQRDLYNWDAGEMYDFELWLTAKTQALVSPSNVHAPCNNYMSCKMCEYMDICLRYGYKLPKTYQEIVEDQAFTDEDGNALFAYDPRDSKSEGDSE